MTNNYYFGKLHKLILFLLIISQVMAVLPNATLNRISLIIALVNYAFIFLACFNLKTRTGILGGIYSIIVCFLVILVLRTPSSFIVSLAIQQTVLFSFLCINYRKVGKNEIKSLNKQLTIAFIMFYMIDLFFKIRYSYDYLSVPLFGLAFFVVFNSKRPKFSLLIMCGLMAIVRARSTALAFFTMFLCMFFIPFFMKKNKRRILFLICVLIIICFIPDLYIWLYNQNYAESLNIFVRETTGKNLFSGRQIIWKYVLELLNYNRIFGVPEKFTILNSELQMSVHNTFLFLRIEGGFFLLFMFLFTFFIVAFLAFKIKNRKLAILSVSYIIGLMVRISFDLNFVANFFVQSMVLWLPIMFMINYYNNEIRNRL